MKRATAYYMALSLGLIVGAVLNLASGAAWVALILAFLGGGNLVAAISYAMGWRGWA